MIRLKNHLKICCFSVQYDFGASSGLTVMVRDG